MNQPELCAAISTLTGDTPRTVERVIRGLRWIVYKEVSQLGSVRLTGLGTFEGYVRKPHAKSNGLFYGAVIVQEPKISLKFLTSEGVQDKLGHLPIPKLQKNRS